MEEILFTQCRRGNNIHIINKNARYELGIIHICGSNYTIDSEEKPFSHLRTAIECLIKNKVSC
jgi:hypothetical protein